MSDPNRLLTTVDSESLSPETAPGAVFDRYARDDVLAYQSCEQCECSIFPPRVLCPGCGHQRLRWCASSGVGEVYSLSTISSRNRDPYTVALVDLAEGFRMMTTVSDLTGREVTIGTAVQVEFDEIGEQRLPVFVTMGDQA